MPEREMTKVGCMKTKIQISQVWFLALNVQISSKFPSSTFTDTYTIQKKIFSKCHGTKPDV